MSASVSQFILALTYSSNTITNFQFVEVYFLSRLIHAIHGYVYCRKESLGLVTIRIGYVITTR